MLNVAMATNDFDAFGRGFLQWYAESSGLSGTQERKLRIFRAALLCWSTCWHHATHRNTDGPHRRFRAVIGEL
jgi:hypothetical protein